MLPQKIRDVTLSLQTRIVLVKTCLKIVAFCRKFSRPRLDFLVKGIYSQKLGGFIFMAVGVLVAVPLGGIVPFKNLFPSLAILFYTTGEIENDGLMILLALICLVLTLIFYGVLMYVIWKFGSAAISHFFWKS